MLSRLEAGYSGDTAHSPPSWGWLSCAASVQYLKPLWHVFHLLFSLCQLRGQTWFLLHHLGMSSIHTDLKTCKNLSFLHFQAPENDFPKENDFSLGTQVEHQQGQDAKGSGSQTQLFRTSGLISTSQGHCEDHVRWDTSLNSSYREWA